MKNSLLYLYCVLTLCCVFGACEKDNYDPPKSMLTGKVVYNGQPVGVRNNGVQLELWQYGFGTFISIPVNVAQDGTFSSELFDGDYKLVRKVRNGPWADNTDSIDIKLRGSTSIDVPVDPFFLVKNEKYAVNGNTLTATFNIEKINQTGAFDEVIMCLGKTIIVDRNNLDGLAWKTNRDITDLTQTITLTTTIPPALMSQKYFYIRLAANAQGANERAYTQSFKFTL